MLLDNMDSYADIKLLLNTIVYTIEEKNSRKLTNNNRLTLSVLSFCIIVSFIISSISNSFPLQSKHDVCYYYKKHE